MNFAHGFVAFFLILLAAPVANQDPVPKLRILVSNDDGIHSPELEALCRELSSIAEVTVCAPHVNRSGASQSATLGRPMTLTERKMQGATRAVAVSGTPADSVSFGLLALAGEKPFDFVVSGINRGANVGDVSHYSGTVGAAMEAVYRGVPAIAVSQDTHATTTVTAAFIRRFILEMRKHDPIPGVVWSINSPREITGPPVVTPMGGSYLQVTGYQKRSETETQQTWDSLLKPGPQGPEGCDTAQFLSGRITVTPLRFDWTHQQAIEIASKWELGDG